jgi:hypothetical protein
MFPATGHQLHREKGLTQEEVEARSGLRQQYRSGLERGYATQPLLRCLSWPGRSMSR